MFIDEVDIVVRAGKGGDGCVAFLREKYRPQGGPAGGDGGDGGSIIFKAHEGIRTLADFRGRRILVAKSGQPGEGKNRRGKSAKNLVVSVPIGTIVKDRDTGEILGDLIKSNQRLVVARGGRGGRGNAKFATSIDQAPRQFEKGEPGEVRNLTLELRLLADVGLVGLPNAGKSTLVGVVSTVRPKVADYPFTTLKPSVGVVRLEDFVSFTIADLPGLIEMAHKGRGLGHRFLKHIKRTSLICHLVEIPLYCDSSIERFEKMLESYRIVRNEIRAYDEELAEKPEVVCWTKSDVLSGDELASLRNDFLNRFIESSGCSSPVFIISALHKKGLDELLSHLVTRLDLMQGFIKKTSKVPEYLDGEPPEGMAAGELSMDVLDSVEAEE